MDSPEVTICMAGPQQHELAALLQRPEDAMPDEMDALLRNQAGHAHHQGLFLGRIQAQPHLQIPACQKAGGAQKLGSISVWMGRAAHCKV